ncbi:hypothetical protein J3Q64DRAFT_1756404 [Phycomyces blakesleeanus]|uniref:Uncharacterized protein n=2 Tax=Phycomyces blakesleeanus TaxID=4837 RepID=A0A163DK75_PHYB8|nr:hypothetical protein PHYBLDRAFT_181888 [Phycomyces blakesleeanus NRRL 1555(-)]OAD71860.1 hypothetical protein PHYBLDRAFT_181888 [Phycomyces blakesleeanus NRRL 1555(-)]|eukprot:XP_018289900.1 hypothetical protein PHYBLDRAFT_181888 [Phycomyces blakesleeanus NRRL 1555(-)]
MVSLSKSFVFSALLLLVLLQTVAADIYSQLQFIKIQSPKSGQNIRAGEKITVKYIMQPLISGGTSMGKAISLKTEFHKRSGNKIQGKLATMHSTCPVTAKNDKYVTHSNVWTVPKTTKPGSYAVSFVENVQLRRGKIVSTESVKINIVD